MNAPDPNMKVRLVEALPALSPHAGRFKAVQTLFDREVEFRVCPANSPEPLAQLFRAELVDLLELDHPAFSSVLDSGVAQGRPFYLVPLHQPALVAHLVPAGALDPADALQLVERLADAMAHAHSQGVALGPQSPFTISWTGRQLRILHHRIAAGVERLPIRDGAPADVREARQPSFATDVFFWGQLAYWVLSPGRTPYPDAGPLTPLQVLNAEVSPALCKLISACLSADLSVRPGHMGEVLGLLESLDDPDAEAEEPDISDGTAEYVLSSLKSLQSQGRIREPGERQWDKTPSQREIPILGADLLAASQAPAAAPASGSLPVRVPQLAIAAAALVLLAVVVPGRSRSRPAGPPSTGTVASHVEDELPVEGLRANPYVRQLLKPRDVDAGDVPRYLRLARRLIKSRQLPAKLAKPEALDAIDARFSKDEEGGRSALVAYLDQLRRALAAQAAADSAGT